MIPLPERIHQIIDGHSGIKASRLCASLAVEFLKVTLADIRMTVITMIANGEIYEIEYLLPSGKNESLLLPVGSKFKGVSRE